MGQRPSSVRSAAAHAFEARVGPGQLLAKDAEAVARACHDMAIRFHRGGKLVVFGNGVPTTDAQHISVEFVHPVIVGKRALPSISLTSDVATITGIARLEGFDQGAKRHEPGRDYEEPDTRDEEQGGKARPAGTSTARYSTGVHPEGAESQTGTEIPPGDQGG